ncbi:MAG: multi-sensor hybrid histidine kinase [Anaerolineales bacterium]|nr:multi-sensor hybrid histidine kinase [Anaerolineales bacterium]
MGSRPLSSLRARLLLLVFLAALPVTLLWGISALQLRQRALLDAEDFVLQVARSAVREHEALVQGARQLLPALAANHEVLALDGPACSREFADLLTAYPQYAVLGAIGADGLVFCSALPFTPPIDVSDRLYFRTAMASGGFAIGEFQIGRVTGIPSVNFGYPAIDDRGRVVAVVVAALDLKWVNDLAAAADLPSGATLTIFDPNGIVLARFPDPEAWVGRADPEAEVVEVALLSAGETSTEARGLDGVEKVYGIVPLGGEEPASRVYLTVGIPVDQVFAPVMAVERSQLIGLILATALAAVGAWFVGERFVVRRVDAILRATRQIGLGHLEARTGVAGGEDELARLAHEFDAMADQLEARESALMEATSELRRVNRALVILSACNQVLIRSAEDRSMAQQICQTIVGQGGFRLAWVGLAEQDNSHNLQVLGQAGPATGYLEETPLTWGGDPARRGPGATAFRTGKTAVVRDVWKDDVTPEWRRLASKYGVASAIGLPLHRAGHVIGALSIYAGQPEAFDLEEVRLLTELADDLSFGLETLRKDAERQRAQADVIRLEAFHRGIVEHVAEGIAVFDEEGHFTFANSAAEGMLAYDPGELLGRHWKSVVAPGDHLGVAARREGLGRGEVDRYEVTLMRKDGQPVQFRVSASSLFEGGERAGTLSVFNDVTTERKYQRRAELQERLAAVGQLAAGIAHDFNNIVGAIILFGELIVDQAHRAAELTQQILDFGRKSIVERRPTDLLRFLREFERLVGRTLPEPITVRIEAADSEYIVDADPGRMQQALLNLALNARDAMPQGGVISFRLARLEVREEAPPYRDMRPGSWVMLSVSDTGTGIPAEILPHVFEPFYTTKPVGEGTGLGLSQVYGIVKQHDGYIDVQSTPGQGTTFMAYFPVTTASLSEAHAAGQAVDVQGNSETILVVEDDEAARNALGETLLRMNYKIVLAEDGAQALELFEAAREQIALVISDVVMPRIGGMELFRELRKLNPEVRALLVTGYPLGKDTRELLEAGKAGWIQKPFDSRTLGTRIRLMLRL